MSLSRGSTTFLVMKKFREIIIAPLHSLFCNTIKTPPLSSQTDPPADNSSRDGGSPPVERAKPPRSPPGSGGGPKGN